MTLTIEEASKARRLFLTKTCGSLSAGTRVTLVTAPGVQNPDQGHWLVQAPIHVALDSRDPRGRTKIVMHTVRVTDSDLVVRRAPHHPQS